MKTVLEMNPLAGFKVGRDHFTQFHLQVHLHTTVNSNEEYGFENAGFRVHYTPASRQFNIGNVQIGQEKIEILPQSESVLVEGGLYFIFQCKFF
jgi:hypothetical protein